MVRHQYILKVTTKVLAKLSPLGAWDYCLREASYRHIYSVCPMKNALLSIFEFTPEFSSGLYITSILSSNLSLNWIKKTIYTSCKFGICAYNIYNSD